MKRQKRVLSLWADAKMVSYCVANLAKAPALSSFCALPVTILESAMPICEYSTRPSHKPNQ
jgi:hypothetical protein